MVSDDGALVVVNGHVVLDEYGQKQRWKPEIHYWTDRFVISRRISVSIKACQVVVQFLVTQLHILDALDALC